MRIAGGIRERVCCVHGAEGEFAIAIRREPPHVELGHVGIGFALGDPLGDLTGEARLYKASRVARSDEAVRHPGSGPSNGWWSGVRLVGPL